MIAASDGSRDVLAGAGDTVRDCDGVTTTEEYPRGGAQPLTPSAARATAINNARVRCCRPLAPGGSVWMSICMLIVRRSYDLRVRRGFACAAAINCCR